MRGIFPCPFQVEQDRFEFTNRPFNNRGGADGTAWRLPVAAYCLLFLAVQIMFSCANIELQPKDPELIALGNFADQATIHLFEMNPNTYEQYQSLIEQDFAPNILSQLKARGACCKSTAEVRKTLEEMQKSNQRVLIRIQSTTFPSKATKIGLVPIEVKGSYVKSINNISKASNFDVLYLIGNSVTTKRPIVASIEIKKF